MDDNKLSKMEIQLYNATRKFANKLKKKDGMEYRTKMVDFLEGIIDIFITVREKYKESHEPVRTTYFRNFDKTGKELIRIGGKLKTKYKSFLLKEIPNIEDKIQKEE